MLSKRKEPRTIVSDQQLDGSADNMFFFFESISTARAALTASRQNKCNYPQQPRPASRQMFLPEVLDVRLPTAADLAIGKNRPSSLPHPPPPAAATTATVVAVPPIMSTVACLPPQETRAQIPPPPPLPATLNQKAPSSTTTTTVADDVKRFLQQIPNLSFMLSPKLSLPSDQSRDKNG
jgi:hypothetical protein